MKKIKITMIVVTLLATGLTAFHPRPRPGSYDFFVTGVDPLSNNYIVTTNIQSCVGPHNVACEVISTTDSFTENGNQEVPKSDCSITGWQFNF